MTWVRRTAAALGAAALLSAYAVTAAQPAAAATREVFTRATLTFDPSELTINVGDTVRWTNPAAGGGAGHTVTSTSGNWSFNQPLTTPGASASLKFTSAGVYDYHCSTHQAQGMTGTITVNGPKPKPTPSRTTAPPRSPTPEPTRSTSSPDPDPSTSTAVPPLPSVSPPGPTQSNTLPSVAPLPSEPEATGTPYLGAGGLTPPPPTGREKGLPVLVAVVFLVGMIAAEVRTLLATPVDE